jgi:hypothetical protein
MGALTANRASGDNIAIQKDILRFIKQNFSKTLTYDWIDGFLEQRASQLKRITIAPHEFTQMQVPLSYLDDDNELVHVYVPFTPAELMHNTDEIDLSDRKKRW